MTKSTIRIHRKGDPPMDFLPPSGLYAQAQDNITAVVIEGGMQSGEPSVCLLGVSKDGVGVILETSLDKMIMMTQGMVSMVEAQLGWVRPEGYAILTHPDIHEQLFHKVPDDNHLLGTPCFDKTCSEAHHVVMWRTES